MLLLDTYLNLLDSAFRNGYRKILCPSLGTGEYCFNHEDIAKEVINIITDFIKDKDIDFDFVIYREEDMLYYKKYIDN